MSEKTYICVFAKEPKPGMVKTRLSSWLGAEAAAELALAFFKDTWTQVSRIDGAEPVLVVQGSPDRFGLGRPPRIFQSSEDNLGERMEEVGRALFLTEDTRVIFLGTDTPGLPIKFLVHAQDLLNRRKAVLGPSDDGGFYLLGLTSYPPTLLSSVVWSHPQTRLLTLTALKKFQMEPTLLEPWFDVDTPKDLLRLHTLIMSGEIQAPETKLCLDIILPRLSPYGFT